MEFPAGAKDWKKFEQNNNTITLNVLYIPHNTKTISVTYRPEYKKSTKNK